MTEIEVKIISINPAEIRKKLLGLGAKLVFKGPVIAKAFDTNSPNGFLRLRKIGSTAELTYKEEVKSKQFKKRNEFQTIVDDFDSMLQILQKLGFKEAIGYSKIRESYQLKGIHFDIDLYSESTGIPPLVEIESTEEGVKEGVKLLGFQMKDTRTVSVWELLNVYKEKRGRNALEGMQNVKNNRN